MVKKCLIAIAVVAMLATTVQAASNPMKNEGWPFQWTVKYDELNICKFDVQLEVGYYVQIDKCDEIGPLKLEQVDCDSSGDFPCYEGCVEFRARANFDAIFGATFRTDNAEAAIVDPANTELKYGDEGDDNDQIAADGEWEWLKLCMTAVKVELWKSGDGKTSGTVKVGEITISVKPPLTNSSGDETDWPPSP